MKPTIEELEAVKKRLGMLLSKQDEDVVRAALTQAIAIEKGESVVVPYQKELGTAIQAIEFALQIKDPYDQNIFLENWYEGDLSEWDDYKAMINAAQEGAKDE